MQAHKYIKTEFLEIQEVYNVFYSRDFPNPLLRADGTLVRNVHEWEAQKAYLRELAQEHMYGTWPHKPDRLTGHCFFSEPAFSGKGLCEKHRLDVVYEETSFTMEISIYRPADVQKHPTIIASSFSNDEKFKNPYLPSLVDRGYAMASFLMSEIVPDVAFLKSMNLSVDENRAYPKIPCGTIMAWAWGYTVVADYIQNMSFVGPMIATGASRGGKAALCAGIFDERFAVTAPMIAGCGGTGSARFCGTADGARQDPARSETIGRITHVFPDWFNDKYATYGQQAEPFAIGDEVNFFPLDANILRAMVAPRAVFSSDGEDDSWSNPFGTQLGWMAAQPVFELLGVPDKNAFNMRSGVHGFDERDWIAMLDFCDQVLFGIRGKASKSLNKPYFREIDITKYASWIR